VNEAAEVVEFAFGNTTFTIWVWDGPEGLKSKIFGYEAFRDLPNWVLAKAPRQAEAIIRGRRERLLKQRGRLPKEPEQLTIPGV